MRKGPGSTYEKWNIWIRGHYPRDLFRLDMGLVYHPAHRRNDVNQKVFTFSIYAGI
jgi:hypothetical protein